MSTHFYLFLPEKAKTINELSSAEVCWVYKDVNNELKLVSGLLEDAVKAVVNNTVTVVLRGEDVLHLTATIPGKNLKQVQQAVPYVLEDSVIDDVDELHFAINKKHNADNEYDVAVINEQYLKSIIAQFEKSGIQVDSIVADYSLLQANTLLTDGTRLLCNCDDRRFSIIQTQNLSISTLGLDDHDIDKLVYCNPDSEAENKLAVFADELKIVAEYSRAHLHFYLVKHIPAITGINLLQGAYRKKKNWSRMGKKWMPAAVAFFAWVLIQGVMFISDYMSLSEQNKKLSEQMAQIYKNTFPGSRHVSNPRARMESQLRSLKKRRGLGGQGFTEMLAGSAAIFASTPGLKIKTLRYYDGRINLELNVASLQALDKLKLQLMNDKGYQVEIQNASSAKENVTARIQITGAAS
jgi:general secretion pathway protein L